MGAMVPFMTMLATTGSAGLMLGTGALAADQQQSLQDAEEDTGLTGQIEGVDAPETMPDWMKMLNATINGIAETGLEAIGNKLMLEPLERAVKNAGREKGRELVQGTLEKGLRKYLGALYPLAPPLI